MITARWYSITWQDSSFYRSEPQRWVGFAYTAEDALVQFRVELPKVQVLKLEPASLEQVVRWHQDHGKPYP